VAEYSVSFQAAPGASETTFRVLLEKYHGGVLVERLVDQELTASPGPTAYCREGCALDTCTQDCWNVIQGEPAKGWCKRWQWCSPNSREHRCSCQTINPWTLEIQWAEGDELRLSVEPGPGVHDIDPDNNLLVIQYGD